MFLINLIIIKAILPTFFWTFPNRKKLYHHQQISQCDWWFIEFSGVLPTFRTILTDSKAVHIYSSQFPQLCEGSCTRLLFFAFAQTNGQGWCKIERQSSCLGRFQWHLCMLFRTNLIRWARSSCSPYKNMPSENQDLFRTLSSEFWWIIGNSWFERVQLRASSTPADT